MFPDEFDYYEAADASEAVALLEEHADAETELLAGGHSLLPAMKSGLSSPDVLIDVGGIDDLRDVRVEGDTLVIGAMTRYSTFLDTEAAHEHAPVLAETLREVGDTQVRNRGTLGGNLAHADPASDLTGAALASDATLVAEGPDGEREIPVDDFYLGMYMTDLAPDEILTRIEVPSAGDAVGAYSKKPSPSSGYALIGVAALVDADGGDVESVRIGANGAMDHAVRLDPVEEALIGESLDDETIEAAAAKATEGLDTSMMMSDLQASAEFREQLLKLHTERALRSATADADAPRAAD